MAVAVAQHRIHWPTISSLWQLADSQDPLCAELADVHYSRRTPGSDRFVALGRVVVLRAEGRASLESDGDE